MVELLPLAVLSDKVWEGLIAAIVTIALAYMAERTRRSVEAAGKKAEADAEAAKKEVSKASVKVDDAARKVDEVKETLDTSNKSVDVKLSDLAKVAEATHTLVNSNMAVQLKLNATVTRRLADVTKDPDDVKAAGLAESLYKEHETKQAKVDEQVGKPAVPPRKEGR